MTNCALDVEAARTLKFWAVSFAEVTMILDETVELPSEEGVAEFVATASAAADEADATTAESTAVAFAPVEPAGMLPLTMSRRHHPPAASVVQTASLNGVRT